MQPSHTKRPGGICDRSSGDRSDVFGTRERPALRIKVAINTATVKECPMPFRHPASSLHSWSVMTHEFRLIFFCLSFSFLLLEPARFFPWYCLRHRFFRLVAREPLQLFLEEYPDWSTFRDGRVGMWPFRKEDAPVGRVSYVCRKRRISSRQDYSLNWLCQKR